MSHTHEYTEVLYSGRGLIQGTRTCEKCGSVDSLLFEYTKKENVWVTGNFAGDNLDQVFIFAGTSGSFKTESETITRELEIKPKFIWVTTDLDWEELAKYRSPNVWFAPDFLEHDVVRDYRFNLLCSVGHL